MCSHRLLFACLSFSHTLSGEVGVVANVGKTPDGYVIEWEGHEDMAYWLNRSNDLVNWQDLTEVTIGEAALLSRSAERSGEDSYFRLLSKPSLLSEAFGSDPRARGWELITHSLELIDEGGWTNAGIAYPEAYIWQSVPISLPPNTYYRVDFSHRGTGTASLSSRAINPDLEWGRYPSSQATEGQLRETDSDNWDTIGSWQHTFFISRTSVHSTSTALLFSGNTVEYDDVVVTTISDEEVLRWADDLYAELPPLNYEPPSARHPYLSRTISLLQSGQPLRILFVGDSLMLDSSFTTLDLLLERQFPGVEVEIQSATGQGTGINKWNDDTNYNWPDQDLDVDNAIIEQQPDLVLLGGISNNFTDWNTSFPELIEKIRTRSVTRWGSAPDIMLLTGPPFYSPEANYNRDLEAIASAEETGFLDLYTAISNYVSEAGEGLTISDLKRDTYHANRYGKQVIGRILLEWLNPETVPLFHYNEIETIILEHTFDDGDTNWQHSRTQVEHGELISESGARWTESVYALPAELPTTDRVCNFYWEMRTDPAAGEDESALHIKLHVTQEPERLEQISINSLLRASYFYMFYIDPGYLIESPHERRPASTPGFFADAEKTEKFRIQTRPVDSETLLAKFQYYDESISEWAEFVDRFEPEQSIDILIDIEADMEGYSTIRGLSFMFPHAAASVQATALTWEALVE